VTEGSRREEHADEVVAAYLAGDQVWRPEPGVPDCRRAPGGRRRARTEGIAVRIPGYCPYKPSRAMMAMANSLLSSRHSALTLSGEGGTIVGPRSVSER
jgi:hypothetical protein